MKKEEILLALGRLEEANADIRRVVTYDWEDTELDTLVENHPTLETTVSLLIASTDAMTLASKALSEALSIIRWGDL